MTKRDARLRNELMAILILKVCVLTVIWWVFIRDARVSVDAEAMLHHTGESLSQTGEPNGN
jgi:cytoskeletal protein RodZ